MKSPRPQIIKPGHNIELSVPVLSPNSLIDTPLDVIINSNINYNLSIHSNNLEGEGYKTAFNLSILIKNQQVASTSQVLKEVTKVTPNP